MKNKQFWANWGCFWIPWEPNPAKKSFFMTGNVKLWPIVKLCIVFNDILAKKTKIIHRKKKKGQFEPNFGPILTNLGKIGVTAIVKILKLKVELFGQGIYWSNVFYFIQKCYGIQKLLLSFWYFCLNLKYLGWSHRAYIKTAKNGGFREELLNENDFEIVLAFFCYFTSSPKSPKWRQKVKHRMWWLLYYLGNFYFIYFLLHVEELNFCFSFFF